MRRTCQPVFFCLKDTIPLAAGKVYRSLRGKDNALRLQQRPLSAGAVEVKAGFCAAEAVHHPMTGNRGVTVGGHGVAYGPGAAGHPRKARDLSVGGHGPGGDMADDVIKALKNKTAHGHNTTALPKPQDEGQNG